MSKNKEILIIENPERIDALVNKKRSLPSDYIPGDLVVVNTLHKVHNDEAKMLRKEAADALEELFNDAKTHGYEFWATSGYRSYDRQVSIFTNYSKEHGEEQANRFSARPGQSEHQTGLTMDVSLASLDYKLTEDLGETVEGKWLADNGHKHGFIIRYQKGTEPITGYKYEPWHIRYLGKDLATKVFESKLTYDEYCEKENMI